MANKAHDGICASESANNAAAAGASYRCFLFGYGSAATAVLLGGLLAWGLKPGTSFKMNLISYGD